MAMKTEALDSMWSVLHPHSVTSAAKIQPGPKEDQDLKERFREATDAIDSKLDHFEESVRLMIRLMDERLTGFEARLPPSPVQPPKPATQAKRHDTPLFSHPP